MSYPSDAPDNNTLQEQKKGYDRGGTHDIEDVDNCQLQNPHTLVNHSQHESTENSSVIENIQKTEHKTPENTVNVILVGLGKMGLELLKALAEKEDISLIGAVSRNSEHINKNPWELVGLNKFSEAQVCSHDKLQELLKGLVGKSENKQPLVMVDFTHPDSVFNNVRCALKFGIHTVVGTTGLSGKQIDELSSMARENDTGCLIIPNFCIGMVLLQQAAVTASQYFDYVDIIELHHNQKADAPSGTAIKTAQAMEEKIGKEKNNIPGQEKKIRIHSVRLPGLVAHQEVRFCRDGQIYTLRHDVTDRASFMPGVLLACEKVIELKSELQYGLENILQQLPPPIINASVKNIGMALLRQAAATASKYFKHVEIIYSPDDNQQHDNQQPDASSEEAIKTAQELAAKAKSGQQFNHPLVEETEKVPEVRGFKTEEGIRIHRVRLPGLVAHQEVIFGAPGQIYTLSASKLRLCQEGNTYSQE